MFTNKEHRGPFEFAEELGSLSLDPDTVENVIPVQSYGSSDNDLLLGSFEKEDSRAVANNDSAYSAPGYSTSLIPDADLLTLTMPSIPSQPSPVLVDLLGLGTPDAPPPPALKLNPKGVLDPGSFQRKWGQLTTTVSQELALNPQGVAALAAPQALLRHMQGRSIQCIASGGQPPNLKFFFFAQRDGETSSFFLVECLINTSSAKAQIKIKTEDPNLSEPFSALFQSALTELSPS
ncbi:Beta-adaptin-like protein A [Platanthera guangdongensis]|uniref:Beta-adaptin-like protein A n=1 Tax=Platanthera guangdongensis TaxID=2320717 RepID=A0ABR2N2A5_9ASPA